MPPVPVLLIDTLCGGYEFKFTRPGARLAVPGRTGV
jgi:hypothetical protein